MERVGKTDGSCGPNGERLPTGVGEGHVFGIGWKVAERPIRLFPVTAGGLGPSVYLSERRGCSDRREKDEFCRGVSAERRQARRVHNLLRRNKPFGAARVKWGRMPKLSMGIGSAERCRL